MPKTERLPEILDRMRNGIMSDDVTRRWAGMIESALSANAEPVEPFAYVDCSGSKVTSCAELVFPREVRKGPRGAKAAWRELPPGLHPLFLRAAPPDAVPVCEGCNGRGEVGGFVNAESGYQADPCPFCAAPPEPVSMLDGWDIRWQIEGDDSLLLIGHPIHGAVGVWKDDESARITTGPILYALAREILESTTPSPTPKKDDDK